MPSREEVVRSGSGAAYLGSSVGRGRNRTTERTASNKKERSNRESTTFVCECQCIELPARPYLRGRGFCRDGASSKAAPRSFRLLSLRSARPWRTMRSLPCWPHAKATSNVEAWGLLCPRHPERQEDQRRHISHGWRHPPHWPMTGIEIPPYNRAT
jgi:hypothetical protein